MKNNFPTFVKKARVNKGWSQLKMAHEFFARYGLIIDVSSISRYERGVIQPDLATASMIAELLEFSLDDALGLEFHCNSSSNDYLITRLCRKLSLFPKDKLEAYDTIITP